jgi:hypothetical protein
MEKAAGEKRIDRCCTATISEDGKGWGGGLERGDRVFVLTLSAVFAVGRYVVDPPKSPFKRGI